MSQVTAKNTHPWSGNELPAGVRFRPALNQEESAISALRRSCGWSADTVAQQFRVMREGRRQIWIAECEGYLVGTGTVEWLTDDRSLADGRTRSHISNLVVHPEYRRRGIAKGLMVAAEGEAQRRGYSLITIGVDRGNNYARALYERRGYSFVKDINAPWGLVHILQRTLV